MDFVTSSARSNPPAMSASAAFGWLGSRDTIRRILYMVMVAMLFVYMYLLFREVMIILLGTPEAEAVTAREGRRPKQGGPAAEFARQGGPGFARKVAGGPAGTGGLAAGGAAGLAGSGIPNQLEWQTTVLQTLRYIEDKVAGMEYRMAINEARRELEQEDCPSPCGLGQYGGCRRPAGSASFQRNAGAQSSARTEALRAEIPTPAAPAAPAAEALRAEIAGRSTPAPAPAPAPRSPAADSSPTYICCDTPAMATQHLVELLADSLASRYHLPQTRDAVRLSLITSLTEMAQRYHGVVIVD